MAQAIPRNCRVVVPNDSSDLPRPYATVYIGGAGNIKVTSENGDTSLFVGVIAGTFLPVSVKRVWATTTTATNLVACW